MKSTQKLLSLGLLFVLIALIEAQSSKYCHGRYSQLCHGSHIACIDYFRRLRRCPQDARSLNLGSLKHAIVAKHNGYRDYLASGRLANAHGSRFPQAAKMPTVSWNDELAYIAQSNANTCVFSHSKCRKTPTYQWAGENIAWGSGYSNHSGAIGMFVDMWWNEYRKASPRVVDRLSGSDMSAGHFTAMAQDKTNQVGCGATSYDRNKLLFVCVYSYTNVLGRPVYVKGRSASQCRRGQNPSYKHLCAVSENVNPNP